MGELLNPSLFYRVYLTDFLQSLLLFGEKPSGARWNKVFGGHSLVQIQAKYSFPELKLCYKPASFLSNFDLNWIIFCGKILLLGSLS